MEKIDTYSNSTSSDVLDTPSKVPMGMSTFMIVMSLLATISNLCVLIILLKTKSLHKNNHVVLILLLCISDINVGLSGVIYGTTFIFPSLSTDRSFCTFHVVIYIIGVGQSLGQSFLICLNRFAATTVNSIVSNMFDRKKKYVWTLAVWVGFAMYVLPTIAIHQKTIKYCSVVSLLGEHYETMAVILSAYAVPVLIMLFTFYIITVLRIRKRYTTIKPIGTVLNSTNESSEKKLQDSILTVGLLLLVLVLFTAPIIFCLLIESFGFRVGRLLRTTLCILPIFNSTFNPIIYASRLKEFQTALAWVFKSG